MYEFGAGKSAIRTVFEETCALREQGRTDFWDFSIGNPYVPAPPKVNETIREVLGQYAPIDLHGYPPNNGWPATRAAVAKNLNERFSTNYSMGDVVMTGGVCRSNHGNHLRAHDRGGGHHCHHPVLP